MIEYCPGKMIIPFYLKVTLLCLADVDISRNPNPFNFCTSESEYIKKTGIRIHFFFKIEGIHELWHAENTIIWSKSIWIHLWRRIRIHFILCHRIRIKLPLERYGPQPTMSIQSTCWQIHQNPSQSNFAFWSKSFEKSWYSFTPVSAVEGIKSICLSVQDTGVLLASWSVQITTYWLLFGFVGYHGSVGYIVCSAGGC